MSVHKINRKDKVLMQVVIVVKISKNEFKLKSILFPRKGGVWGGGTCTSHRRDWLSGLDPLRPPLQFLQKKNIARGTAVQYFCLTCS